MTSEYFRLGLRITCSLGPTACRAKGSLPAYPLRRRQDWSRDAGKVCPLLVLALPYPLPHLEVPFLNHQVPELEGLKGSSGPTPCHGAGVTERKRLAQGHRARQGKDCLGEEQCGIVVG